MQVPNIVPVIRIVHFLIYQYFTLTNNPKSKKF